MAVHNLPLEVTEVQAVRKIWSTFSFQQLSVPTRDGYSFLKISTILRCESDGAYTRIYNTEGKNILVCKPLWQLEEQLRDHGFLRVHRSHLVNINHLAHYNRLEGSVELADGSKVKVSRNNRDTFIKEICKAS